MDWSEILHTFNTQESFDLFYSKLLALHEKYFPKIRIKKKYSNRKPWLSEALWVSIRHKNKLYHRYKKISSVKNETTYKIYRNKLTTLLRVAEKKHYGDLLLFHHDNLKKSWTVINNIINKHRRPRYQTKFKLNNGIVTEDKKIISQKFNDFFINVGPSLANSIPNVNKSPVSCMGIMIKESFFLSPVTNEEIKKIVNSLKDSATG